MGYIQETNIQEGDNKMLNKNQKEVLRSYRFSDEDFDKIETFDEKDRWVVYKDGRSRRLTDVITRSMGYLSSFNLFNNGKQSEYKERKWFTESKANKTNK